MNLHLVFLFTVPLSSLLREGQSEISFMSEKLMKNRALLSKTMFYSWVYLVYNLYYSPPEGIGHVL